MKTKKNSLKSKSRSNTMEIELLKRIKKGDMKARDKLVEINQGLVYSIAKKYTFSHDNLEDLIAEGNMGLLKAIEKYDPKKHTKFVTYAYFWVRRYVMRAIMDQLLTAPENVQKLKTKYKDALERFKIEKNRHPKDSEIASLLKLNLKTFLRYKKYFGSTKIPASLPGNEDENIDLFEIRDTEKTGKKWDKILMDKDLLNILFERIKKKHKKVSIEKWIDALKLHYGVENVNTYSYKEIARKMNITRQRVHQIIKTCIKYLHEEIKEMKNEGII